ncbi:MAG: restriction endonuclease subunit S [Bacteroidales bacterium]|nr:restriction endonuclease subunit S [Bacteroidales bacterium]
MNTPYHRLGDYIREVNVRNRDLKVTKLVGLTIDKAFIPSVANVIGTDLSNYKVIRKEQFACSLMQVSRDGKMPIAMFEEDEAIMSPAYPMFEVVDKTVLMPQYLMMWFSRSEFDREASYYAVGGVRGSLTWEDFCNMRLPVPTLSRQRELVAEYETLTRRIRLNEQMIAKLEETAQALYRKMFVEGVDKERLPEGWRIGKLGEIATFKYGKLSEKHQRCAEFPYPVFSGYAVTGYTNEYTLKEPTIVIIARGDAGTGKICMSPRECFLSNLAISIETKEPSIKNYLYYYLLDSDTMSLRSGSAQAQITINNIEPFEIIIPKRKLFVDFSMKVETLYNNKTLYEQEIFKLAELQSLLLARMGK